MKTKKLIVGALGLLTALTLSAALAAPAGAKKKQKDLPRVTHDGLELLLDTEVAAAWVKPGADFSGYDRLLLLDTYVAFKKNWASDFNRSSVYRVTSRDVERMKADMAELFREVFIEVLDTEGGYPVVEETGEDVLLLRPGIIDLDVTAPALDRAPRSYNFAASAGEATLYLELYDSVSGEILARAIDRKADRDYGGFMQWTSKVTNRVAAQRVLTEWAELLKARLDEIHSD